jgi:hypothetical protein
MSVPSIELAWGGQSWKRSRKRTVRPLVRSAIELAEDGLEYLGVDYDEQIRANVYAVAKNWESIGEAKESQNGIDLYIPHKDVKRKKVASYFNALCLTTVHEALHLVRGSKYPNDSLIETAAAEGICYASEITLAKCLLTAEERSSVYGNLVQPLNAKVVEAMKQHIFADNIDYADLDENTNSEFDIYDVWFSPAVNGYASAGNRLGYTAVVGLMQEGVRIPEIIEMPAAEILGIH